MKLTGRIIKSTDTEIFINASFPGYLKEKFNVSTVEIIVSDGRHISADQRKKIYATFRDISLFTGHEILDLKNIFKADFIAKTGESWFSLSTVDMTTANHFLQYLIDFCLVWNVASKESYLERSPDVSRYLYMCLATRTCAVCGKRAEIHHSGNDRIGMGRDRDSISHLGLKAVALCQRHHEFMIHTMSESEFFKKYHIWPIKLDEYLCKKLGLKI